MKRNVKKEKKWWQHLIVIPVMLAVDLIVLAAAGMADSASAGDGPGHPMPALMLAAVLIFGVLTVILTLRALILCVRTIVRNRRGGGQTEPGQGQNAVQRRSKKVWRCFIPLMIEIPLSIAAVVICGQAEINSFYNDPTHVGFAIPMGAILLAGFCFLLTIVLIVICVIAAVRRDSLNKENSSADTGR